MAILDFDRGAMRTIPRVWINRIALYSSLDPPTPIREPITFTAGLNIIWGIEDETNAAHFEPGHGVGKTTLCRLIRFCLGESTYGQEHAAKEIQHTFPDGAVAAEVQIEGQRWSVLRPFDKRHSDCAQADGTIESLVENRPTRASFGEYLSCLMSTCLTGIRTESVLSGGDSIQWGHLLAMCARDQEARYQSMWQWRSPRSDSGSPRIQKEDAFLTIRSVLDLLPDAETKLQRKLSKTESDLAEAERGIVERKREPDYWISHCRRLLRDDFGIAEATDASLNPQDLFNLPKLVGARVAKLESEQQGRRHELAALDRKIAIAAAALQEPAELHDQEQTAVNVTGSGTDTLESSIDELRQIDRHIREAELSLCRYGQVTIGNCTHAKQQLVELDEQIRDAEKSTVPESAKRDQITAGLKERVLRRAEVLRRLQSDVDKLNEERRTLDDERRNADEEIKDAKKALECIIRWERLRSGEEDDSELARLHEHKKNLESSQVNTNSRLTALLAENDQRTGQLRQVYEALVRGTLTAEFNGRVRLTRDGLEFRIFRGENLSGEAFETLSILLADLTVLLTGALGISAHPGFLIHDSPREADLGRIIYERLLTCVWNVASELGELTAVPFQYIVTTTTPPPADLRKKATTRLKLGGKEGMLFGQQLHVGNEQQELDLDRPGKGDAG